MVIDLTGFIPNRLYTFGLTLLLALNLLLQSSADASQLVQVALSDHSQLQRLQEAGLDVSYFSDGGLAEVILMNEDDKERLNATGFPYFVSVPNVENFNRLRLAPGRDDMGGYRTFDEIVAEMVRLHEAYPEIIGEPVEFGRTIEDRPMLAMRVSDNPDEDEDEPEALFFSLIHCREVVTSYILFGVIDQLVQGYGNDERLTRLVDERQIWFIPVANPDGYVFNEEDSPDGGGMWRKNRHQFEDREGIGVDLNRNFGSHWGFDNVGSSSNSTSETFRGEEAFSEPETQSIREFVNSRHLSVSISFHSYSNLCLYPHSYDVIQPADRSLFTALAKKMTASNHYVPGTGWEVIYRTNGDSDDWLYSNDDHDPILAFTMEVGTRADYFWPPLERVEPLVTENIEPVLTMIEYADTPQRVLAPPQPVITRASITPDGQLSLRWTSSDDEHNPPVTYRIKSHLPGEPVIDEALPDQTRWERVNFSLSQGQHRSGSHSYRPALQSPMSTLTLAEPIVAPDTLRAWMSYSLRSNRSHGVALEASIDGYTWEPLPGNLTQEIVVNQQSIGQAVYGISGGWVEAYWLLGDYAGRVVKLRYRYYSFNLPPNPANSEFCYIDDISPIPVYSRDDDIAAEVEGLGWDGRVENQEQNLVYTVEAIDSDGDISFSSLPVTAAALDESLVLRCDAGWSLVSAPYLAANPTLTSIFSPWLERESLVIIKDGWGRFFLPQMNFNQIGDWNPTYGYLVKMSQPDTLVFPGMKIPDNTPIALMHGWNSIGYLPIIPMSAEDALNGIVDNLILAKNGLGEFWLVEGGFSNLRTLESGMGLAVKLTDEDTLIYPEGEAGQVAATRHFPLNGFVPETPLNMSLLFNLPENHPAGTIVLYDAEGNYSGSSTVSATDDRVGVAAWREENEGGVGFAEGESLKVYWRSPAGEECRLSPQIVIGSDRFETDGFARLGVEMGELPLSLEFTLNAIPNPFNGKATFQMSISHQTDVGLKIFDSAGRLVQDYRIGIRPAGKFEVIWEATDSPNGLYLAKMTAGGNGFIQSARIKMVLLK